MELKEYHYVYYSYEEWGNSDEIMAQKLLKDYEV